MTPSITDIVVAIQEDLAAHGMNPDFRFGKDIPAQEGDPEQGRVVFWPGPFQVLPVMRRSGGNPRQLATWKQQLLIRVWKRAQEQTLDPTKQFGADWDAALQLGHAVVASLVRVLSYGSVELAGGAPQDKTKTVVFGVELDFSATVWLPVIDQSWSTVHTASDDVDYADLPSGLHQGKPAL
jgi:hypothetical protein